MSPGKSGKKGLRTEGSAWLTARAQGSRISYALRGYTVAQQHVARGKGVSMERTSRACGDRLATDRDPRHQGNGDCRGETSQTGLPWTRRSPAPGIGHDQNLSHGADDQSFKGVRAQVADLRHSAKQTSGGRAVELAWASHRSALPPLRETQETRGRVELAHGRRLTRGDSNALHSSRVLDVGIGWVRRAARGQHRRLSSTGRNPASARPAAVGCLECRAWTVEQHVLKADRWNEHGAFETAHRASRRAAPEAFG
jgi:hypothetical protein